MPKRKAKPEHFPTSVRFTRELLEWYRAEAEKLRRPLSYVIVEVLETHKGYVEKVERRHKRQQGIAS